MLHYKNICCTWFSFVRFKGQVYFVHAAKCVIGDPDKRSYFSLSTFHVFLSSWIVVGGLPGCSV